MKLPIEKSKGPWKKGKKPQTLSDMTKIRNEKDALKSKISKLEDKEYQVAEYSPKQATEISNKVEKLKTKVAELNKLLNTDIWR